MPAMRPLREVLREFAKEPVDVRVGGGDGHPSCGLHAEGFHAHDIDAEDPDEPENLAKVGLLMVEPAACIEKRWARARNDDEGFLALEQALRLAVRDGIGAAFAHDVVDPGLQRRRYAE